MTQYLAAVTVIVPDYDEAIASPWYFHRSGYQPDLGKHKRARVGSWRGGPSRAGPTVE
jgi:hypothetical protein